jgi:phage recombination protein Bet
MLMSLERQYNLAKELREFDEKKERQMVEKKLEKKTQNIFSLMAAKYNLDPQKFLDTILATVIKTGKDGRKATMEEVAAFLIVANKYGLDPFTNEIYAYPSKKGGIIPVVGIDGFVRKINNHKDFDGMEIEFSDEEKTMPGAKQCPDWCEVKLYRKGINRPIVVREYLDEVFRSLDYVNPWQTHTKRMLRHKAIIQAGRAAGFLTGVYDPDEAERIIEAEIHEPALTKKPDVEMPQAISDQSDEPIQEKNTDVRLSTEAQQKAIHTLATKIYGKDQSKFIERLGKEYGVEHTKELTLSQASKVIDTFSKELLGNGK